MLMQHYKLNSNTCIMLTLRVYTATSINDDFWYIKFVFVKIFNPEIQRKTFQPIVLPKICTAIS